MLPGANPLAAGAHSLAGEVWEFASGTSMAQRIGRAVLAVSALGSPHRQVIRRLGAPGVLVVKAAWPWFAAGTRSRRLRFLKGELGGMARGELTRKRWPGRFGHDPV
jgi:hypothetical protein